VNPAGLALASPLGEAGPSRTITPERETMTEHAARAALMRHMQLHSPGMHFADCTVLVCNAFPPDERRQAVNDQLNETRDTLAIALAEHRNVKLGHTGRFVHCTEGPCTYFPVSERRTIDEATPINESNDPAADERMSLDDMRRYVDKVRKELVTLAGKVDELRTVPWSETAIRTIVERLDRIGAQAHDVAEHQGTREDP
jgi:hypothetical protein